MKHLVWAGLLISAVFFAGAGCWGEESAVSFFKDHAKPVECRESADRVWLANRQTGIEILKKGGSFYLSRIYGIERETDFLSPASEVDGRDVWQLVLRRDQGRNDNGIVVSGSQGAVASSRVVRSAGGVTLYLQWKSLDIPGEADCLDVQASISLSAGDPLSRWRISVANRSKIWGLWKVSFPMLELRPIGNPDTDRLVCPRGRGVLKDRLFTEKADYSSLYPAGFNMQFFALYDSRGDGLYFAEHDGGGNRKDIQITTDPSRRVLNYNVLNSPANMGYPAEDYRMEFDAVIGPFQGDWYDAAQIYRKWAVKQEWCSKGPLTTRKDIPKWYKEAPVMLTTYSNGGDTHVEQVRDRMLKLIPFLDTELPNVWYEWKKHIPEMTDYNHEGSPYKVPDRSALPCENIHDGNYPFLPAWPAFSGACERILKAGGRVTSYVCAAIYDPGIKENAPLAAQAKPNMARDVKGKIIIGDGPDIAWRPCPHTAWWQQRMKETVTELQKKEHVGGIYFDVFYGGLTQCFDTSHGHSHGGGNEAYLGDRKLSAIVRGAMKKQDPESVMTGENPGETAIDLLDGFLSPFTFEFTTIPLLGTVYGDYIPRYGRWILPESDGFYVQCASLFTEGEQMGRLDIQYKDYLEGFEAGSPYTDKMHFLRRLARYWKPDVGAKYLAYGQLLRPIRFTQPDPMPTVSYEESIYRIKGIMTFPALQSGVFLGRDGSLGVFIVNVSDQPQRYDFQLTRDLYPVSGTYRVSRVSEFGGRTPAAMSEGVLQISGSVAAHQVALLEAEPVK